MLETLSPSRAYYEEQTEQKKPLAFDLSKEKAHILERGNAYYEDWINNAESYANEYIGRVSSASYKVGMIKDGRVFWDGLNSFAEDSYWRAVMKKDDPVWYRKRAVNDIRRLRILEDYARQNLPEDVFFIDASPPTFSIDENERKNRGMGDYSYWRLYQIKQENGERVVRARYFLHYLSLPEQISLFKQLTGVNADERTIHRVLPVISGTALGIEDVDNADQFVPLIKEFQRLYEETPQGRRIPIKETSWEQKELQKLLELARPQLQVLFNMISEGMPDAFVLHEFLVWEGFIKELVKGNATPETIARFSEKNGEKILSQYRHLFNNDHAPEHFAHLYETLIQDRIRYIMSSRDSFMGGSCGSGVGFSEETPFSGTAFNLSYGVDVNNGASDSGPLTASEAKADPNLCRCGGKEPHFHCPGKNGACNHAIIVGKGINSCPECGQGKIC